MMRLIVFTKARSHKYLRKVGSGAKARYIYKEPTQTSLGLEIAHSFEVAGKQQAAHEKLWEHKVKTLPIGTKVGHWIATDVAGERFWIHDTKGHGIGDRGLVLEVGQAAIDHALRHRLGVGTRILNRPRSVVP